MTRDRASLRIGISIALAAFAADIFVICWSPNFDIFILLFLIAPITILIFVALVIWAGTKMATVLGTVLFVCLVGTYATGRYSALLRSEIRWWSSRPVWEERVLARPEYPGQLKHLEWDGWGIFAQDTQVYLVYDPSDGLSNATETTNGLHAPGLPCDVWKIYRLQSHWYNVIFYTNTAWDACPLAARQELYMLKSPTVQTLR